MNLIFFCSSARFGISKRLCSNTASNGCDETESSTYCLIYFIKMKTIPPAPTETTALWKRKENIGKKKRKKQIRWIYIYWLYFVRRLGLSYVWNKKGWKRICGVRGKYRSLIYSINVCMLVWLCVFTLEYHTAIEAYGRQTRLTLLSWSVGFFFFRLYTVLSVALALYGYFIIIHKFSSQFRHSSRTMTQHNTAHHKPVSWLGEWVHFVAK